MATEPNESTNPEEKVETETQTEEVKNPLEMSDEEFLKTPPPGAAPAEESTEEEKTEGSEKAGNDSQPSGDAGETEAESVKSGNEPPPPKKAVSEGKEPAGKEQAKPPVKKSAAEAEGTEPAKAEDAPVDYEGFFKQIMTPFKANGKTFEIKTPEEAVRLMQQGAGYGRKLQDMQPHLKVLRMLEKNNLLDEGKLSYLIDLNQKKPDAIKKLIKDGGIDPLDLNTDDKVTYTPTNHAVSDKEVVFHQAIAEVQNQPGGHATLQHINQTWDEESKGLLWDEPEIFGVIQGQRENGVYDQILSEIERQKLLGHIKNGTPFLQAYKVAGDHLVKTNGFKAPVQTQAAAPIQTAQPQVIATRTATPKSQARNGERAAAASPTKAVASSKPTSTVNPLQMADDDFMKQFSGRF
jgi:hypothetical protein